MTTRSYNQHCGLSYALDIIGDRWTILVLRELIGGPRRFTDLIEGLPGISTNLLAERLKSLEQHGVIRRRVLPPPAASSVYELTALGCGLEPMLIELGKWGSQFAPVDPGSAAVLHMGSYILTLKTFFRPELAAGVDVTYELRVGEEALVLRIAGQAIDVRFGEAPAPDAVITSDVAGLLGLLQRLYSPAEAISSGIIRVEGAPGALERIVALCGLPEAAKYHPAH